MDRDALERLLAQRRAEADALTTNLVDLEAEPAAVLVKAGTLEGRSAQAGEQCRQALDALWADLTALRSHLDAAAAAKSSGWRGDTEELRRLLTSSSVVLDTTTLAASDRSATGPTVVSTTMSVEKLLERIKERYSTAAVIIGSMTEATAKSGPMLNRARRAAAELFPAEAAALNAQADAAADLALTDPLALVDALVPLEEAVEGAEASVRVAAQARAELPERLADAEITLSMLDETIRVGADALAEARMKITDPVGLLEPLDALSLIDRGERALRPWLARITGSAAANPRAAQAGLDAWRTVADGALVQARDVVAANEAPVAARNELRGRLDAMAAKARGRNLAEIPDVAAAHTRARDILWTAPCDLGDAAAAVEAYRVVLDANEGDRRHDGPAAHEKSEAT